MVRPRADAHIPVVPLTAGRMTDTVPGWGPVRFSPQMVTLTADQEKAVHAWRSTGRGVIAMPTGTGKTEVALHLMARLGVSTLVVLPIRDLMYQWHQRIQARLGYDAGIIGDSCFDVRPVTVTTYDQPGRNYRMMPHSEISPSESEMTTHPSPALDRKA